MILKHCVIDYEEDESVFIAYMKAGLPWIDVPTDNAIKNLYYLILRIGRKNKICFNGSDFRSEGKQPSEWTYADSKQMIFYLEKFGKVKFKSLPFPELLFSDILNLSNKRNKNYRPF